MFNLSRTAIKFLGLVFFGTASHAMVNEEIHDEDSAEFSTARMEQNDIAIKILQEISNPNASDEFRKHLSDSRICVYKKVPMLDGPALVVEMAPYTLKEFYEKYSLLHENVINFAEQIAMGLAFLHEQKKPHTNFISSNIVVTKRLDLRLVDFSLAELKELGETENTRWEAPEIEMMKAKEIIPSREAHMMGNMYSYGIILGEMKLRHKPVKNVAIDPSWPEHFKDLLKDLWAQEPSERPTCMQVQRRLLKDEFDIMKARCADVPGYR